MEEVDPAEALREFQKLVGSAEQIAEEIASNRKKIVECDRRRNKNREALRLFRKGVVEKESNVWVASGDLFIKSEGSSVVDALERDQFELDKEVDRLRQLVKEGVQRLQVMQGEGPLKGYDLIPLSEEDQDMVFG